MNLTLTDREWDIIKDEGRLTDQQTNEVRKEPWFTRIQSRLDAASDLDEVMKQTPYSGQQSP